MTFASDSFTNTDDTGLASHNAAWVRNSNFTADIAVIKSNKLTGYVNAGSTAYVRDAAASADYEVSALITQIDTNTSANAGLVARMTSTTPVGYMCRYRYNTGVQLFKLPNSVTAVQLGSTVAGNLSNGGSMTLKLRCEGDQISVYKDGSLVIGPITDTATTAANSPGIWIFGSGTIGCSIDNWDASYLSGGGSAIATISNHIARLRRA